MPFATCQVDLDGLWAIRRCYEHPDAGGQEAAGKPEDDDPVYAKGLPRFLELFEQAGVKATFFVVGQDAAVSWKAELLRQAVAAGHELANHSHSHELDMAALSPEQQQQEIAQAQQAIEAAVGHRPRGFRAPGYSLSPSLLQLLAAAGYLYDASLLPTHWGWLLRGITRWLASGPTSPSQFSGCWAGPRPLDAFRPEPDAKLWELPVAVSPRWRLPFHGGMALTLGRRYFNSCLKSCRKAGICLHYVMHGVELTGLGAHELTGRSRGRIFFSKSEKERNDFTRETLKNILVCYQSLTMLEFAQQLGAKKAAK